MDPILLKTVHLTGAFALLSALGALLFGRGSGAGLLALHGVSALLVLLAGFALLGKPPMGQYWWMLKLGLLAFLWAAPALSRRKSLPPALLFVLVLVGAGCAVWLGLRKPF